MAKWKALPDDLPSDVRLLVAELRTLKIRSGLSLAALAERTPYSKSSWERYLNGKTLPPRQAVTVLGKLSDAEPARLAALWELAQTATHDQQAGSGRSVQAAPPEAAVDLTAATASTPSASATEATASSDDSVAPRTPVATTGDAGRWRPLRSVRLLWAGALLLAVVLLGTFAVLMNGDSPARTARAAVSATDTAGRQLDVNCFADSCAGKDPKEAGCGGDAWTSAMTKVQQVYVELRYSDACRAAWARISWGRPGDIARVVGPGSSAHQNKVHYDTDTYSAMLAAPTPSAVRACAVLTSGRHGCTGPGGSQRLTEPPNPPVPSLSATQPRSTGPSRSGTG